MPKKITATTPDKTLTRSTDRTYTHVIIAIGRPEAQIREEWANELKYRVKEAAKYKAVIDSGIVPPSRASFTIADYERWYADVNGRNETHAARLEAELAKNAAFERF